MSEARLESAPILPLSGGPFSLQIALSGASEEGSDPFLALSDDDEFARVLLGVIKGDTDTVVDLCAVKLPRNAYRLGALHEASSWTNHAVEERWSFESSRLSELERASRFVPRLIRPASTSKETSRIGPLFLCRTGKRFFAPPCPRCAGALATCRDEVQLAAAGLPSFRGSLERFLRCSACAAEDASAPFYAFEVSPELAGKAVLSAADLARDLGEALTGGVEADALRAAVSCPDCVRAGKEHRDAVGSGARPRPFWEDRWAPLAFFDGPFLVTGLDPFDLDEFSDLLGGRPPETLWAGKPGAAALAAAARARHPAALEEGTGRPRWLFEGDGSGSDAVELFAVKLAAFRQIAQAVLEYSRALGRPHLDLHPRHLLFDLARIGEGLPLFWNFQMRLHGISTAARVERLAGIADAVIPPRNPAVPYAPPEVLEFHLTPPRPAQLVWTEVEAGGRQSGSGVRLHGRLSDPYGIFPNPRLLDWILLTIDNEALGLAGVSIACRRDPRTEADPREVAFISEPVAVEEAVAQRLRKAAGVRIPGVRYKVYSDFGTPSDLYSLGMILLRLLVGNDRQDAGAIARIVERIAKRLSRAGEVTLDNLDSPGGASALLDREPDILTALNKSNIFYQDIDRRPERPNAIPDPLWKRAILLAMRLGTRVEGFSFCAHPADYEESHPRAKLESLLQDVDLLGQQLRSLLFNRQGINLEIQQVLSEVLAEKPPIEKAAPG